MRDSKYREADKLNSIIQNAMMPNGAMCSSAPSMMSSPGPQAPMPTGPDGQPDPRSYMMMSSTSSMPVWPYHSQGFLFSLDY